jgi:CRISPR-associated protein Csy3
MAMELSNFLKYERSLHPGKAVFFYKTPESEFIPLEADITRIRGQKAGFTEGFNISFEPKNVAPQDLAHCNPITIEECYVPPNVEHIYCRFSLRVQANSLTPNACNNDDVITLLRLLSKQFNACGGYKELATRYCKNLMLGTWLWRNQNSGDTHILIKTSLGNTYQVENTRQLAWESRWNDNDLKTLEQLSIELSNALTDPTIYWSADITAKISTSFCQEIFPSQVFNMKADKVDVTKNFSKVKCLDGRYAVSFNSVKIGAALQLIDDWWGDSKRLRVHEYGADKENNIARRMPNTVLNFYSIFINVEHYLEELNQLDAHDFQAINPDIYYLFAVLIKGGMFQKKAEVKKGE